MNEVEENDNTLILTAWRERERERVWKVRVGLKAVGRLVNCSERAVVTLIYIESVRVTGAQSVISTTLRGARPAGS